MKKFFNISGLFIAIFAVTAFTSCNNDNEPNNRFTITASNVQACGCSRVNRIATVKATLFHRGETFVVGEAPFRNRGFNMTLATDIPSLFLFPVEWLEDIGTLDINNRYANIAVLGVEGFVAFDRDGEINKMARTSTAYYYALWIYADRNVTVRGSYTSSWGSESHYDLNLRSGWNAVFLRVEFDKNYSSIHTSTLTTQRPNNVTFVWEFSCGLD